MAACHKESSRRQTGSCMEWVRPVLTVRVRNTSAPCSWWTRDYRRLGGVATEPPRTIQSNDVHRFGHKDSPVHSATIITVEIRRSHQLLKRKIPFDPA